MLDTRFGNELVAGARLIVSRRGYEHHGIYSGDGRVIHYAGRVRYPQGRVEEISLQDFVGNRPVYACRAPDRPRAEDIVRRARSRLGECRYDLLTNNCEHFCNWCQLGEPRSQQIESLATPVRLLVHAAATVASLVPVLKRSRASRALALFNTDSPGQRWRRFLSLVSLIKSDGALAASTASLTRRWSS